MTPSLVDNSVVELRRLICTRQLPPVELLDACIERIGCFNPAVKAICATDFSRASEAARLADQQLMRGDVPGLQRLIPDLQSLLLARPKPSPSSRIRRSRREAAIPDQA
jgi:hypothetical protein